MPPRSSRAARPRPRAATSPVRWPSSGSFRPMRARRPKRGSRVCRRAPPPSTRAAAIPGQGRRTDTSVMGLAAAVAAIAVATVMLWSILRAILRAPDVVSRYMRIRRGERGYRAVSQGLIAVGSGDARAAKKFTAEAVRIAPREPLTLLLSAQTAQLSGDRDAAVATFQEMADRDDTRVLGLHGLFVEAQRRHDHAAALAYAEEAAKHASVPVWARQAGVGFRCGAGG